MYKIFKLRLQLPFVFELLGVTMSVCLSVCLWNILHNTVVVVFVICALLQYVYVLLHAKWCSSRNSQFYFTDFYQVRGL